VKIIFENKDLLVIDKSAGIVVFPERKGEEKTLIDLLLQKWPKLKRAGPAPRYGIVHRLDKDSSGILLVAKNDKTLNFLQGQFKNRKVEKKYLALVIGNLKSNQGLIETFMARGGKDRRKQKIFLPFEPTAQGKKLRRATTKYKVVQRFKNYTLLEALPKTGRKHQLRAHFAYLGHPIVGDKLYGFKGQCCPKELKRQFLHASYLKIQLPDEKIKEFESKLPNDLKRVLKKLKND